MSTVVVLTRDFAYWGERPLRDALRLIVKGKVEVVAADESKVIQAGIDRNGITFKLPAPLVIRLLNFVGVHIKHESVTFSKEAVFARDDGICQYWHKDPMGNRYKHKCSPKEMTLDHVIPKVKGGQNTFENTVCCCRKCNERIKRGRLLKDCGLELIRQPFVPKRKKGDMVVIKFQFNPDSLAHRLLKESMGF